MTQLLRVATNRFSSAHFGLQIYYPVERISFLLSIDSAWCEIQENFSDKHSSMLKAIVALFWKKKKSQQTISSVI